MTENNKWKMGNVIKALKLDLDDPEFIEFKNHATEAAIKFQINKDCREKKGEAEKE